MINFGIKFITPLLTGGATRNSRENEGLTGKALRGVWRFWFRAVVGGQFDEVKPELQVQILKALEERIFGSTVRAKFRMLVEPGPLEPEKYRISPSDKKKFKIEGWRPGAAFDVSIFPRPGPGSLTSDEIRVLLATIWIWGNLGSVGKRARRGFGSPVLIQCEANGHDQSEQTPKRLFQSMAGETAGTNFACEEYFGDAKALNDHLLCGLKEASKIFAAWLSSVTWPEGGVDPKVLEKIVKWREEGPMQKADCIFSNEIQQNAEFFILKSFRQVFVGTKSFPLDSDENGEMEKFLFKIHGEKNVPALGFPIDPNAKPKGADKNWGYSRWASPEYIRTHIISGAGKSGELVPILTRALQKRISFGADMMPFKARLYLMNIGFIRSLNGDGI